MLRNEYGNHKPIIYLTVTNGEHHLCGGLLARCEVGPPVIKTILEIILTTVDAAFAAFNKVVAE